MPPCFSKRLAFAGEKIWDNSDSASARERRKGLGYTPGAIAICRSFQVAGGLSSLDRACCRRRLSLEGG